MTPHESEHQSKREFPESTASATINTSESESSKGSNGHPDNHQQPFRVGEFVDYMIQHPKVKDAWSAYTQHEFVKKLGAGTLDVEVFKFYLVQDYIFLVCLF